jgi:DNA-directed RNA polymerase
MTTMQPDDDDLPEIEHLLQEWGKTAIAYNQAVIDVLGHVYSSGHTMASIDLTIENPSRQSWDKLDVPITQIGVMETKSVTLSRNVKITLIRPSEAYVASVLRKTEADNEGE